MTVSFAGHLQVSVKHSWGGMCSPPDSIPMLQLLVQLLQAKRIVEVGVFTGEYIIFGAIFMCAFRQLT